MVNMQVDASMIRTEIKVLLIFMGNPSCFMNENHPTHPPVQAPHKPHLTMRARATLTPSLVEATLQEDGVKPKIAVMKMDNCDFAARFLQSVL